jgi:hypothetical protein
MVAPSVGMELSCDRLRERKLNKVKIAPKRRARPG